MKNDMYRMGAHKNMESIVGERLKQLVKEKGMEQQQAAAELGMKSPTFNGYVSNHRAPSIERLKQFAKYFDVSVDYLIGCTELRNPYAAHLSDELKDFINNPENTAYLELAMDIKEKTLSAGKKHIMDKQNCN